MLTKIFGISQSQVEQFDVLAREAYEINKQRKELEKREKLLMEQLKQKAKYENYATEMFALTYTERKGAVEYSKIEVLKKINLDEYRKEPVKSWKLNKL